MKKIIMFLVCIFLCASFASADPIIYEKPDVKIIVEGTDLELDGEVPIIVNSRTLVPLRKLLVGLGVPDNTENIQWIGEKREVKVIYNGVNIDLAIDNSKGYINGKEYVLDAAPIIHKDRTYLPARFVGEALGYTISWDAYTPAVLVTSNKNMDKIKEILNDLKTAMNNVKSYEAISLRITSIDNFYDGENDKLEYETSNIERADLDKKIIYTESGYTDESEKSFSFSYNTDDAYYNCYKYLEDDILYGSEWSKYPYDQEIDESTPFEGKEKLGLVEFAEELYGLLLVKEYSNAYVISVPSSQIDVLKSLNGIALYNEISEIGKVQEFDFQLAISKETKLPIKLDIKYNLVIEENLGDQNDVFKSVENTSYEIEYIEYNQYVDLKVPEVVN